MKTRHFVLLFVLVWAIIFGLAYTVSAQTSGQMAYDVYNGTVFEQKLLSPSEGQFLKWQSGVLVNAAAGGSIADGDKGDVIVSGSGEVWTLDTTAVTPGSYTYGSFTVDSKGRLTAASNGTAPAFPAGSGTEWQYRLNGTTFGALPGTSVDVATPRIETLKFGTLRGVTSGSAAGGTITLLGGADAVGEGQAGGAGGTIQGDGGVGGEFMAGGDAGYILFNGQEGDSGGATGGFLDLTGGGQIGLGWSGTRTLIVGNATADRTLNLPDASGTLLLSNGSGASLTSLNASNLASGTVSTARLGTGTADSTTFLRGDQTWAALTTLPTAGTAGNVLTSDGSNWSSQGALSQIRLVDHFMGQMTLNTRVSGAGAQVNNSTSTILGRPAAHVQSGTTTTGLAQFCERFGGSGTAGAFVTGQSALDMCWGAVLSALSDGTNTFSVRAGVETSNLSSTNAGIFFRYTHSVNSGNWQCVTRSGGVETVTNTSIAPTTAAWQKMRITVNSAGTSCGFEIDGTTVATHTTNIPASCGYAIGILKSAGTTNRILYVSHFSYLQTLNTPW